MSFRQLKAELDEGKKRNLYIFTGEEREVLWKYIFRIDEKAKTVPSLERVIPTLQSKHLFNFGKTFVIVDDKEVLGYSSKELLKLAGNNTLIFIFDKIDSRTKFAKEAKKYIVEFAKFTEEQLASIVMKELPGISQQLAQVVARYSNNEVGILELEIDKLKVLSMQKPVDLELLNEVMTAPLEDRIFDMVDAVAKKDHKKAFALYHDLMELKESPIKIVSILYTKFKHVFLVQAYYNLNNNELAQRTGLTYYQVNFARELAGTFTLDRLVSILKLIQQTEVEMKTGQADINQAMDVLLLEILK